MSIALTNVQARSTKIALIVIAAAALVAVFGALALTTTTDVSAAVPADFGLKEGQVISAAGSDDPDVYIVNDWMYKRLFLNPAIFTMYGHLGGFAAVKNVPASTRDSFMTSGLFRNCETNDQKVYGVEVTGEDTGILHWVNVTGAQAVAQDPNFFNKIFCINTTEFNWYSKGSDYTSLAQIPVYTRGTGTTPTPTPVVGALNAFVASDNPAAGTAVETQALYDLAHFQITGAGTVTSMQFKKIGVAADTVYEDVFLFVNGVRVSDSGNVSSGMITFNNAMGLFAAPATVVVKSDISGSSTGSTIGLQLTMVNSQTFALSGNIHGIAPVGNLAGVAVGSITAPGNFDPQNDVSVWKSTVTISNEDVYLKRVSLREIGSVDSADVRNLRLLIDGVQVATDADLDAEGYVTFLMNHRVLTGAREFKVLADVVGGSTRTVSFSLRGSYDLEAMDESLSLNVEPTGTFPATATAATIGGGSVTVTKATNSPSGDVVDEATDIAYARWELKAFGEAVKIETLVVRASVSDSGIAGLSNGRLMINGSQYGNTTTISTTASTSFTVNYTLAAGSTAVLEVRADVKESSSGTDVTSADVISMLLEGGDNNNGYGVVSANQVDIPTSTLESNNVTVTSATATLSKNSSYSDQVVTLPRSGYLIGKWTLTGSSAEAINLSTFSIDVDAVDGSTFTAADLTNMWVKYGTQQTSPKSTVSAADNEYSISRTIAINEVLMIELYADLGSNVTVTDSFRADLSITGTGASSGVAVSNSDSLGQEIDTAAGTFTSSVDTGAAKLALSNSAVGAGTWRFRGDNEDFKITDMVFKVASGSTEADVVTSLTLKSGGVAIATNPLTLVGDDYVATFTGLTLQTGLNGEKVLTVDINTADVTTIVATGKNVFLTLDSVTYQDTNGVEATSTTDRIGGNVYVHDGLPTLAKTGTAVTGTLSPGDQALAEFSVTPNGNVGLKRIRFDITKTSTLGFASTAFTIFENGSEITSVASISQEESSDGPGSTSTRVIVEFNSERTLSGVTTYRLNGNIGTWVADAALVTNMNADSATATPAAYTSVAASAKFVWTDRSASSHAESTADWMNGYLLQSLPLSWGKNS